ncbi:MAG TPA: S8 family serine peptidase, partial [Candidatus Dormibacteraeota bacterium]
MHGCDGRRREGVPHVQPPPRRVRRLLLLCGCAAAFAVVAAVPAQAAGTATPNDPYFVEHDQWPLAGQPASIDAPGAWTASTGAGVLVADIDTGADFNHPDLAGRLVTGGRFTKCDGTLQATDQASVQDDVGHGTMTTGLMVAGTNNGTGIASVAPDARALIIKVIDKSGTGCDPDISAAIKYAVSRGTKVINISLGSDIPLAPLLIGSTIPAAVRAAAQSGAAVALAAGNSSLPFSDYDSVTDVALVVGALGPDASVAPYSTSGGGVNIYAPGGDSGQSGSGPHAKGQVLSTALSNGGYTAAQGTSFAAPHVAGVLALLLSCGLDAPQARQRILSTARGSGGGVP